MKISGVFSTKVLNYDDSHLFISLKDGETFLKGKVALMVMISSFMIVKWLKQLKKNYIIFWGKV